MAGNQMLDRISSVATVGRAFGEPVEHVTSGGGGGAGDDGSDGGFGLRAKARRAEAVAPEEATEDAAPAGGLRARTLR